MNSISEKKRPTRMHMARMKNISMTSQQVREVRKLNTVSVKKRMKSLIMVRELQKVNTIFEKRLTRRNMARMKNTSVISVTSQHVREVQKVDRMEQRLYDSLVGRKWGNCSSQASNRMTSVSSVIRATSVTTVTSLEARQGQKVNTVSERKRLRRMHRAMMKNTLATRGFFEWG